MHRELLIFLGRVTPEDDDQVNDELIKVLRSIPSQVYNDPAKLGLNLEVVRPDNVDVHLTILCSFIATPSFKHHQICTWLETP
jgi:hypothetical protein